MAKFMAFNSATFKTTTGVEIAASSSVEVRRESDAGLAAIFSDRAGTIPLANPFTADAKGRFKFYAAGLVGGYQISVTKDAETHTLRNVPMGTVQEMDADDFWVPLLGSVDAATVRSLLDLYSTSESDAAAIALIASISPLPMSEMRGLTLSNNGSDATNDIDIEAGRCRDASDAVNLILSGALTKRIDATWVTGTNQGGRASSQSLADGTWHMFLIRVGGVVDVGFDTSATGANLIADHSATHVRRIGSIVRISGAIKKFWQIGDEFYWDAGVQDFSGTSPTARTTLTCTVPTGLNLQALLFAFINANAANNVALWIGDLRITDAAPGTGFTMPFEAQHGDTTSGWGLGAGYYRARTNTAGQVGYRCSNAVAGCAIRTFGWIDTRGRFQQ